MTLALHSPWKPALAKAPATLRAYRRGFAAFSRWCAAFGIDPLPVDPETVAIYALSLLGRGCGRSVIDAALASIAFANEEQGLLSPCSQPVVRMVTTWARQNGGHEGSRTVQLGADELRSIVCALPRTLKGVRDRAVLMVGCAGAFRANEIGALDVHDVETSAGHATLTVRTSARRVVLLRLEQSELCPVRSLEEWLEESRVTQGPLFPTLTPHGTVRGGRLANGDLAHIVKTAAARAGLDGTRYGWLSLRGVMWPPFRSARRQPPDRGGSPWAAP